MKISSALLLSVAPLGLIATGAAAQNADIPPPQRYQFDANGVDLVDLSFMDRSVDVSIGPDGPGGLQHTRMFGSTYGGSSNYELSLYSSNGVNWSAQIGATSETFTLSGSTFTSNAQQGATLVKTGTTTAPIYTLTQTDGTRFTYSVVGATNEPGTRVRISKITYPTGDETTVTWASITYCTSFQYWRSAPVAPEGGETADATPSGSRSAPMGGANNMVPLDCAPAAQQTRKRVQAVSTNSNYQLRYDYAVNYVTTWQDQAGSWRNDSGDWLRPTATTGINTAVEACDPNAMQCTLSGNWPRSTYSFSPLNQAIRYIYVTDPAGRLTRYSYGNGGYAIKRPGSASDNITVSVVPGSSLTYTRDGRSWAYTRSVANGIATTTRIDPLQRQTTVTASEATRQLLSTTNALTQATQYTYDSAGRLLRATATEGNYTDYVYDPRGNVTQVKTTPKGGGTPITTYASYPGVCSNGITCNKPLTSTDAGGAVTDYAYDPTHGGATSITLPAGPNGVRPQTRFAYTQIGALHRPLSVSSCRTATSCAGSGDEVRATIGYGANALPATSSSGAGNGAVTATNAISYDAIGNVVAVDGPLPGSADTSRMVYSVAREMRGMIGPDPDGGGPLLPRAMAYARDADGDVIQIDRGMVSSGAVTVDAMTVLERQAIVYDAAKRPVTQSLVAGGTTHAVSQTSYTLTDQVECQVQRMNPAAFGSLPGACSLGTQGGFGPDRISKTSYDALDRPTLVQTALSTPAESQEYAAAYTPNGKLFIARDAGFNRTTYAYDGFDRLIKSSFPSPTSPGFSSATDFEALTYDSRGNVTQRRLRDGSVINYTYDALGRMTLKDVPAGAYQEHDVSYGHDNLGRPTVATNAAGQSITFGYDGLGRMTSEGSPSGTKTLAYDLAGRATRITHPDGVYFDYDYLVTGETAAIRENGAVSGIGVLARYSYDNLGRRTLLTRGNATTTSYGYDAASRLTALGQDVLGTAQDLSLGFSHNPAGQIASQTRSNNVYSWAGHYNVDRPYAVNGLNQVTQSGGVAIGYDGRGNLTSSAGTSYAYTSENRLSQAGATSLGYDPVGRLSYKLVGGVPSRMGYLGDALIAELSDTNAVQRRYVYGPGADEPLVWYEGAGTTQRYWLHADERGSVIAVTDGAGTTVGTNTYDEHGIPAATNMGRFQYTGQAWLPEIGLYYYKARMYSATLGRFMQTDPIGYGDGMNMYAYVGGDPVNRMDPSGLADGPVCKGREPGCDYIDAPAYDGPDIPVVAILPPGPSLANVVSSSPAAGGESAGGGGASSSSSQNSTADDIVVTARRLSSSLDKARSSTSRGFTLAFRAVSRSLYLVRDLIFTPACGCPANSVENKQANDAKRQAERQTGVKFTRAQERRFHDNVTGMYLGYQELVDEAAFILTGQW